MKERDVEGWLVSQAKLAGGLAAKHISPGRAGDPDRIVALPHDRCPACGSTASVGLLELKRPGGQPRPLQRERIREWESVGVRAGWAATFDEVDAFLRGLRR